MTCKVKDCPYKETWRIAVVPSHAWHTANVLGKEEQHTLNLEEVKE